MFGEHIVNTHKNDNFRTFDETSDRDDCLGQMYA